MELGVPITSRSNARVKALRAALQGNARRPGELVGLEGEHLIAEAARSGVELEALFVREGSEEVLQRPALAALGSRPWTVLSADVFASAMETESPQPVAALAKIPSPQLTALNAASTVLLLEAIQDPGNLGTLVRSAEAFGASMVMMTPDCANPWSPKVLRASAGSVFRVAMRRAPLAELREALSAAKIRSIAAVAPEQGGASIFAASLGAGCALMIGNEGAGLSAEALAMAGARVTIPCAIESLNAAVAGSLLLYEAMRQRNANEGAQ